MPRRVEAAEFYAKVGPEEEKLVADVIGLILKIVKENQNWHGVIALVGGRLNKPGPRKDIDIAVIVSDYSYAGILTQAIETEIIGPDRPFAYQRLGNEYNFSVALYLKDPNRLHGTPVHLILPTHGIGSNSLDSRWPWHRNRKYAVLAEF